MLIAQLDWYVGVVTQEGHDSHPMRHNQAMPNVNHMLWLYEQPSFLLDLTDDRLDEQLSVAHLASR